MKHQILGILVLMTWTTLTLAQEIPENPLSYTQTLEAGNLARIDLLQVYQAATTDRQRAAVLQKAGHQLTNLVAHRIAPYWYGTPWNFNGTSQVPGQGTIACGYLVTTMLRDAGVHLERVHLAQQASEAIIRSLVSVGSIKRFSNASLGNFVVAVQKWGKGLYIVGLDFHVGFIVNDDKGVHFLHSSFVPPSCVISEPAGTSPVLGSSRYRVLGKLSDDQGFLKAWLLGKTPTVH